MEKINKNIFIFNCLTSKLNDQYLSFRFRFIFLKLFFENRPLDKEELKYFPEITIVSDRSVSKCICDLRKILNDKNHEIIQSITIPNKTNKNKRPNKVKYFLNTKDYNFIINCNK